MGTHGDFDKLALSVCRQLKEKYKDITIQVIITSLHQIYSSKVDVAFENKELNPYIDVETIMYDIENEHFKRKIIVSNKHMIENSDTLICYVNPQKSLSGAKIIMKFAEKKGLEILNLYNEEDDN